MNIKKLLLGALFGVAATQETEGFTPLSHGVQSQIVNTLNGYRSNVHPQAAKMQKVQYSTDFQIKLDALISANGGRWMFENATNHYGQGVIQQGINGYYVPWMLGEGDTWQSAWHDTCSHLGNNCAMTNIHYRANQAAKCFEYANCSDGPYGRFKSCETALTEVGSGHPCSFAWIYWPNFIAEGMNEIACAVLEVPGWKPPPGQLNSYWCYRNKLAFTSDKPYQAGASCSECEPEETCKKKLCVS